MRQKSLGRCWKVTSAICTTTAKVTVPPESSRIPRTTLQPLQVGFRWLAKQNLIPTNPVADLALLRLEKRLPRTILSIDQVELVPQKK